MRAHAGAYILFLLALAGASQADQSPVEAPRRQTQAEFIEEWARITAGTAQRILERSSTAPATPLVLEVIPEQPSFPLFSPVTALVRLTNTGAQPVDGNFQLGEVFGRLFVYVAGRNQQFVPYLSQAFVYAQVSDLEVPRSTLPSKASITAHVSILYTHATKGYAFPTSGTYRVKMVFAYRTDYSLVSSNEVRFRIVNPRDEDADASALFKGEEEAKVLQGESTNPEAIARLRQVVERWPDSDYALYAQVALSSLRPEVSGFPQLRADRVLGPHHRALLGADMRTLRDTTQTTLARMAAARRIGREFGHKASIPLLTKIAGDIHEGVDLRLGALVALSQIPDESVVPVLLNVAIDEKDPKLRDAARYQLESVLGIPASRTWWQENKTHWVPQQRWHALSSSL